ncbi:hypothetical protein D3C72_1170830 [compost metagenome]
MFIPRHIELSENGFRLAQLPFPTVDQNDIRDFGLFNGFTIATAEHLIHRRIVITRRNPGDVVATIFRAHRPVGIKHHTGGDGLLTHCMGDVETLHPLHVRQFQQRSQRRQALVNGRLLRKLRRQRRRGVGPRQLQIARAIAARFGLNVNATPCQLGKGVRQQSFIIKIKIEQDLRWQRAHLAALQIELTDEGFNYFTQLSAARHFREIAAAAQNFALTNKQNMDAGQPGIKGNANDVQIVAGIRHKLFFRNAPHRLNLIADTCGLFERQRLAGFFHSRNQLR